MNLIHLTQAIYFQPNPSAIMAEDLMHWVNRLESKPDPEEGDEIIRRQPACNHPAFWGFLHKFLPNLFITDLLGLHLVRCSRLRYVVSKRQGWWNLLVSIDCCFRIFYIYWVMLPWASKVS
jgi:hypothetical protein